MKEIYGSRTEEFGVDMLGDAAGTAGTAAGSTIGLGGMGIWGWIAIIVAVLFLFSLLLLYLSPLFVNIPPPAAPRWADAIRSAPSQEALPQLSGAVTTVDEDSSELTPAQEVNKEIVERGGSFPGITTGHQPLDEAA
jgi:hypothetical protein